MAREGGIKALVIGPAMGHDDDMEESGEHDAADYRDKLRPVAKSLVEALGLPEDGVDLDGVCDALADAHAICADYVEGKEPKGDAEDEEKPKEY